MNPAHLAYEAAFWYDCANTYNEERKQHVYAKHMGITQDHKWPFGYLAEGKRVLDIGGGPVSMLLKTTGFKSATVQDPTEYPTWVYARYLEHKIAISRTPGENRMGCIDGLSWLAVGDKPNPYDEVWLYNCLQHTEDPKRILANVGEYLEHGGTFRFFEWVNIPPHEGHPHMITVDMFDPIRVIGQKRQLPQHVSKGHIDVDGCYGEFIAGWVQL